MAAPFNPLALLAERTCAPIYSAIDTGNTVLAIRHADRILAQQPNLSLASALKAVALIRSGRRADASKICDDLLKRDLSKNGEFNIVHMLTWSLSRLGRNNDELGLLDRAAKAQPENEDLARQYFTALIKNRQYQKAQQLALKMHKSFGGRAKTRKLQDRYFWWSIQAYLLLSKHSDQPGAALALPLSERMIQKQIESRPFSDKNEEELWLFLNVLSKLGKKAEAFELLSKSDSVGAVLSDRSLSIEFLRRELAEELGNWKFVFDEATAKIQTGGRNWAHVQALIQAATKLGASGIADAEKLFESIIKSPEGTVDRTGRLARLELLRSKQLDSSSSSTAALLSALVLDYFQVFGSKSCCHEDLLSYLSLLDPSQRREISEKLQQKLRKGPFKEEKHLRQTINILKIQRSLISPDELTAEKESERAALAMQDYISGLEIGKDLPETEMHPADDLALLSAQALVSAYVLSSNDTTYLHQAVAFLEFACGKSNKGYQLRMLLIRCYSILGCFDRASIHYKLIGIKAVQNDTLSHLFSDRLSTFTAHGTAVSATSGGLGLHDMAAAMIATAEEIYGENRRSVPEMIVQAFEHGTYSRIEEFVKFGEALDRSVQRQILRIESARIKLLSLPKSAGEELDLLEKQIATLAEQVDEALRLGCHDQRDYTVLPNLQPLGAPALDELTALGPRASAGWLRSMSAFLQRSPAQDSGELTPREREMIHGDSAFFEARKSLIASQTVPFDILHTATTTLEAFRIHTAESDRETARAYLAEMATLVNHAARKLSSDDQREREWTAFTSGMKALGQDKVAALRRSTIENTSRSLRRVLDATRDALREA